jgi:hypothetical protein
LRDAQVMMEWVQAIAPVADEAAAALSLHLSGQEARHKESASEALHDFNQKKWASWTRLLSNRAQRVPIGSMTFQHLALQRWIEAHALHRQALRNRSHTAFHRLRIGLKKFRYTVENFLPDRYAIWGDELGETQDTLGEMHDLHVLWQTALAIKAFPSEEIRAKWRLRISGEIGQRLEKYRQKMLGIKSRWYVWRAELPQQESLRMAALARLRTWASFRDPDFVRSSHTAMLALQIYDGLESLGLTGDHDLAGARFLLEAAAVAHNAGMYKTKKKPHLASYRMLRKIPPSLRQTAFSGIPEENFKKICLLAGILRLANAFDRRLKSVQRLTLTRSAEVLRIHAQGYAEEDASAEKLSGSSHLLEAACKMPILICPI